MAVTVLFLKFHSVFYGILISVLLTFLVSAFGTKKVKTCVCGTHANEFFIANRMFTYENNQICINIPLDATRHIFVFVYRCVSQKRGSKDARITIIITIIKASKL